MVSLNGCHFQFPSHRDVLCDSFAMSAKIETIFFQFPSHRDVLCDKFIRPHTTHRTITFSSLLIGMCFATHLLKELTNGSQRLSVPFSSGCALRLSSADMTAWRPTELSVPFSSGCALRLESTTLISYWPRNSQFPSHRDVLCDEKVKSVKLAIPHHFQFP